MGSLEASRAPDGTAPEDERAGAPQDQREASGARPLTVAEQRRQISRANRLVRYEQIIALHRQGLSQRAIARQLHVSRKVVHRSVNAGTFPERTPTGKRQSKLDPFLPYLRKRWEQGCHNGLQLARELRVQGFRGSASLVGKLIGAWRARLPGPAERVRGKKRQAAPPARRRLTPRQASWLFVKDQAQLTTDQRALTQRICHTNADLQELYQLGQDFVQMVKQRQARRLDGWLARAQQSSSVELRGFASGIKRDYAAVKAALSLPWSQGQVEGHITRLKFLKRQMYGRAHFDVLRSRVLRRA
jgi:transposase